MIDLVTNNLDRIHDACARHDVKNLWIFGSAATGSWVEGKSDVDFLVELGDSEERWFNQFFGLYGELEDILGTPIDLVQTEDVRSQLLSLDLHRQKVHVYEHGRTKIPA